MTCTRMFTAIFWESEHFEITNLSIGSRMEKKMLLRLHNGLHMYINTDKPYKYNIEKETVAGNMQYVIYENVKNSPHNIVIIQGFIHML